MLGCPDGYARRLIPVAEADGLPGGSYFRLCEQQFQLLRRDCPADRATRCDVALVSCLSRRGEMRKMSSPARQLALVTMVDHHNSAEFGRSA